MTTSPSLFDAPAGPEPGTHEGRARRFHEAHPEVYELLVDRALQLKARGFTRYSIKGLWEVIRWQRAVAAGSGEEWAMNNNYTAFYARLIMEQEADLAGFFITRERKAQ